MNNIILIICLQIYLYTESYVVHLWQILNHDHSLTVKNLDLNLLAQPLVEKEIYFLQYIHTKFNQVVFVDTTFKSESQGITGNNIAKTQFKEHNKLRYTRINPMELEDKKD